MKIAVLKNFPLSFSHKHCTPAFFTNDPTIPDRVKNLRHQDFNDNQFKPQMLYIDKNPTLTSKDSIKVRVTEDINKQTLGENFVITTSKNGDMWTGTVNEMLKDLKENQSSINGKRHFEIVNDLFETMRFKKYNNDFLSFLEFNYDLNDSIMSEALMKEGFINFGNSKFIPQSTTPNLENAIV